MEANIRVAVVVAEFNSEITKKMLAQALKRLSDLRIATTYVCKVPGSFDMPLIIQTLLGKEDVDAVVALGAIVKGETGHDKIIASALARQLSELSVRHAKPVALGVSGPSMTWEQAVARAEEYANRSVDSAVKMVRVHKEVMKRKDNTAYPLVIE
jgi:6,7-dimethyl-8-ribityllumazine synthase